MKIQHHEREYSTVELVARGDYCDVYRGAIDNKESRPVAIKVVRDAADNDLMENERVMLTKLGSPPGQEDEGHFRFLPKLLASDMVDGKAVHVLPWYGDYVSVAQVIQAYPDGLDWRDMVWMFKRTLDALGFVHQNGIIHGAIVPTNLLVHPVTHGIRLIDWGYAVQLPTEDTEEEGTHERKTAWDRLLGEDDTPSEVRVKAISAGYPTFYPPEILERKRPSASSDIFMAARCAQALTGKTDVPGNLKSFFESLTVADPTRRSKDQAWDLFDVFKDHVNSITKPAYRELKMPGYVYER